MKTIQSLLFALAISSLSLHGMNTSPWYEKPWIYKMGVPIIDSLITMKANLAFMFFKLSQGNKDHSAFHRQLVENKLAQHEKNIREDEEKCVEALLNDYPITPESKKSIKKITKFAKRAEQLFVDDMLFEAPHDDGFPSQIFPIFTKNGMKPHSIFLVSSQDSRDDITTADSFNAAINFKFSINENQEVFFNDDMHFTSAPGIVLYPQFYTHDNIEQKAILTHEVKHLKENHGIKYSYLTNLLSMWTKKSSLEILNNQHAKNLEVVYERQADVLSSLDDIDSAHAIRYSSSRGYYPTKQPFLKHYAQLAEIEELHKLGARLERSKPAKAPKIDDLKVMKRFDRTLV